MNHHKALLNQGKYINRIKKLKVLIMLIQILDQNFNIIIKNY